MGKVWEISAKILNSKAVGVKQSFLFLEQNTWFLQKKIALFKVFYGLSHYVIYQNIKLSV